MALQAETKMQLNNNSFFIFNKVYEHAKLAMWGTGDREIGTFEGLVYPDQIWLLEESTKYPGYYYINNCKNEGYRIAKWGSGDTDMGNYTGQYYDDQLWKFNKEGDFYRIYNKKYTEDKIAKWGKKDEDFGTYVGPNYDDQLWKLVPRFEARAAESVLWEVDNRQGTKDVTKQFKITTGVKLTHSETLSTKFGFKYSLKASLSAGIPGLSAGMESQYTLSLEIDSSITSSEEKDWSKESLTTYVAPAGKQYKVVQTLLNFSSALEVDNCALYCKERIEESD